MQQYEFLFTSRSALERAFSRALSCAGAAECVAVTGPLRLELRAMAGPAAEGLLRQIRRDGAIARSRATRVRDPRG